MANPDPHCRIGRITRKGGGATVRVLRPGDDGTAKHTLAKFREHAGLLEGWFRDDAAGYVIVMWDKAGRYSRAIRTTNWSPWGPRTARVMVAHILQMDTMADVTRGVLNRDDPP